MLIATKNPGEPLKYKEIPEITLDFLQSEVFGYIETISTTPFYEQNIVIIVNEEGKLRAMPVNFQTRNDVIVGPAVFTDDGGDTFESLTERQIIFLEERFGEGQKINIGNPNDAHRLLVTEIDRLEKENKELKALLQQTRIDRDTYHEDAMMHERSNAMLTHMYSRK